MIPRKPVYEFHSVFAPSIHEYLAIKEALGEKITLPGNTLRQFDRYCSSIGLEDARLTTELAENWLLTKAGENRKREQAGYLYYGALHGIFQPMAETLHGGQLPDMRDAGKGMFRISTQKKK